MDEKKKPMSEREGIIGGERSREGKREHYSDVREMPNKDSQSSKVIRAPQASCAIVRGRCKIGSQRTEIYIPNWIVVSTITGNVKSGFAVQVPQSNCKEKQKGREERMIKKKTNKQTQRKVCPFIISLPVLSSEQVINN